MQRMLENDEQGLFSSSFNDGCVGAEAAQRGCQPHGFGNSCATDGVCPSLCSEAAETPTVVPWREEKQACQNSNCPAAADVCLESNHMIPTTTPERIDPAETLIEPFAQMDDRPSMTTLSQESVPIGTSPLPMQGSEAVEMAEVGSVAGLDDEVLAVAAVDAEEAALSDDWLAVTHAMLSANSRG